MELHEALSQIAEIRTRLAETESFRGYRAFPVAVTGGIAVLAAAAQATLVPDPAGHLLGYLGLWTAAAITAMAVAGSGIWLRLRSADNPVGRELTRLAVGQFLPCLAAGAMVTVAVTVHSPQFGWALPGLWQVLFSLGIFASCRLLPRAIVGVGLFYLTAGTLNLSYGHGEVAFSPWVMGLPFAVGQFVTAGILYWHLERHDG